MLTYFIFQGKLFHLTDGVVMDSPVSSVVANLFLQDFEEKVLDQEGSVRPPEWHRFVDIFSLCKREQLSDMLHFLNCQDSDIQFMVQTEIDSVLPFLDTNVQRTDDGKKRTGVYRKPTHSGRVLSFQVHRPISAKKSNSQSPSL